METFLPALIGASIGVLIISALLPTDKLRRSKREMSAVAFASMAGASLVGLVIGNLADGLLSGAAMALAFILMPEVVLGVRSANTHEPGR